MNLENLLNKIHSQMDIVWDPVCGVQRQIQTHSGGTLTEFLVCEMALGMVVVPALPCE